MQCSRRERGREERGRLVAIDVEQQWEYINMYV